jgi:hypothetical protein
VSYFCRAALGARGRRSSNLGFQGLRAYPKNPGKEWDALSESLIHLRSSVFICGFKFLKSTFRIGSKNVLTAEAVAITAK